MPITERLSLKARVICPVARPAVENAVVEIEAGNVVEIHARPHSTTIDLGNVALLPGLVNAHTHLEFSNLAGPLCPPHPFADWIKSVVAERRRRCETEAPPATTRIEKDPIARGLRECFETGTSAVGDIVTGFLDDADDSAPVIEAIQAGRLMPFRELLAPTASGVAATWAKAEEYLQKVEALIPGRRSGLSPHASYTITRDLFDQAIARAVRDQRPLAIHLVETREELELLRLGTGPLVEMLKRLGQWDEGARAGTRPLDYQQALSNAPRVLIIHGNYLDNEELQFLGQHPQMSLVYCPRTHRYFGHSRYPLDEAIRSGVNIALGTDSRASNPDLNLWEEAKTVAALFPHISPTEIIQMATSNGARALGQTSRHGIIEPGRPADLCCVQLAAGETDPLRAALLPQACVVGAMHAGRWIGTLPECDPH